MSREIKFRAWNTIDSKHVGWSTLMQSAFNVQTEYMGLLYSAFIADEMILEQYTGLKDKNGKEIYEGDICANIMPCGRLVTCKWNRMQHRWSWYSIETDDIYCHLECGCGDPEIIGNIHENKELLS